ncbi:MULTISPECIES: hypothetical protein [unclassified Sphingomonas]|uniref:hypothetical protein n=1 Tax=unclassified Sphingomonas TaxID=196159 RepID=UPI001050AAE9|nr:MULTISPECIES: hypothetical protein [unclassified Sphingomonas]TCP96108.1 hypothetical protein C8J46_11044 [Sphingomonas sp. PP-F2F-A104-K0414]
MEQRIIHACGHEQGHYLTGFDSQQERKAKWLKTTTCRDCFVAEKRAAEAAAAALSNAAVSHLDLPLLTGSDRQISWASTIRTKRLAALTNPNSDADCSACLQVTDAKWWIDRRDLTDVDLMAAAAQAPDLQSATVVTASITDMPRTA